MSGAPTALVIGGSGPVGPHVVDRLLGRGYDVSILHRGVHEVELPPEVRHVHADPHFEEPLREAVGDGFDLVVAMYGRLRLVAEVVRRRTDRLVSLGGRALYRFSHVPVGEADGLARGGAAHIDKMIRAEEAVLGAHGRGDYRATHLRLPLVYGPRQAIPFEWSIVRRLHDGRRRFLLPWSGTRLESRVHSQDVADVIAACVDQDATAGEVLNVAEARVHTDAQWLALVAEACGVPGDDIEIVDVPPDRARAVMPPLFIGWEGHRELEAQPHRVLDVSRLARYLPPLSVTPEKVARTVSSLLAASPEARAAAEQALGDPFDYEAEDAIFRSRPVPAATGEGWAGGPADGRPRHPYPHPKRR